MADIRTASRYSNVLILCHSPQAPVRIQMLNRDRNVRESTVSVKPRCMRGALICLWFSSFVFGQPFHPSIPKAWDDTEINRFELPLAQADRSPRYPSAAEYYDLPVRPIYRSYPVYPSNREPVGYWESLLQKEPEIVFDVSTLKTKEDWIRAGQVVFEASTTFISPSRRNLELASLAAVPGPTLADGAVPEMRYVIRKKGIVEIGVESCAECHTRVLPDGAAVEGPPSNDPNSRRVGWRTEQRGEADLARIQNNWASFFTAPWAANQTDISKLTLAETVRRWNAMQPGVAPREGTGWRHPVKIPSLIGVRNLRYLDATGLSRNRSEADLMRYAIVNQGLINVARYGDYQPRRLSPADSRYSDEQLYALVLYLYSLKPPVNPNPLDDVARRGQLIFNREGCAGCHQPPLYTNNQLTPALGFKVPESLRRTEQILDVSVGTEPGLALETRRGTGFYKVPSLRGVWMRQAFNHEGSAASLEEWFDPARLNADYIPKGFHLEPGPIRGHDFGLNLMPEDRVALIAFLKTL